jgi:hypothetical protein
MRAISPKVVAQARHQGMRLGLRMAHDVLRKARNYQVQQFKKAGIKNPDKQAEHDYCANTLQALCLRLQEEVEKAK